MQADIDWHRLKEAAGLAENTPQKYVQKGRGKERGGKAGREAAQPAEEADKVSVIEHVKRTAKKCAEGMPNRKMSKQQAEMAVECSVCLGKEQLVAFECAHMVCADCVALLRSTRATLGSPTDRMACPACGMKVPVPAIEQTDAQKKMLSADVLADVAKLVELYDGLRGTLTQLETMIGAMLPALSEKRNSDLAGLGEFFGELSVVLDSRMAARSGDLEQDVREVVRGLVDVPEAVLRDVYRARGLMTLLEAQRERCWEARSEAEAAEYVRAFERNCDALMRLMVGLEEGRGPGIDAERQMWERLSRRLKAYRAALQTELSRVGHLQHT